MPISVIATVRPYDDPGVDRAYYRLRKIHSTIVRKTHMVVVWSDERLARYRELFGSGVKLVAEPGRVIVGDAVIRSGSPRPGANGWPPWTATAARADTDPAAVIDTYGDVAQAFLPKIAPGILGLFLAAVLAGVMSSCDAFMVSSAALFTENVYKPAVPGRTERHYVWIGRLTSVMVVAGGVIFALWVPTVVKALEIWFMIAPMMGLVFWIGLLWRRLTVVGAWVTTLSGFATWWITTQSWFIDWVARLPVAEAWRLLWVENGKTSLYLPWQILLYMTVAVVAGVVVSLFTRPVSQDKLDRFYTLSRTPIAPGEQLVEPCVLPPSTAAAKRTMLVTFAGLEIPLPSRVSLIGFVVVWICVALMIGGFVGMVSWS